MSFATLALISAAALLGPLLAAPRRLQVPVLIGELAAGVALGRTGLQVLHAAEPTFAFLANIGFALIMFVAGSHVPVRDARLRQSLRRGAARAVAVGLLAALLGWALATAFATGHPALYAVLIASSSAALVLPLVDALRLQGPDTLDLLAQVAIADTACIVALPLVIEPQHAGGAAVGAVVVVAAAAAAFLGLRAAERSGARKRLHRLSEHRKFALELRISLLVLFVLAALARRTQVSVMLAGFSLGLAVTAVGEPRRLAHQLFALTEGFFGPLFFVWVGASLDLRAFGTHPEYVALGAALGGCAVGAHAVMRIVGQPVAFGAMSAAQLGVPIAAVAVGMQRHLLPPGEPAAIVLGALVTVAAATVAAMLTARSAATTPPGASGRRRAPAVPAARR